MGGKKTLSRDLHIVSPESEIKVVNLELTHCCTKSLAALPRLSGPDEEYSASLIVRFMSFSTS